jgi:LacI family transcriptional regulator
MKTMRHIALILSINKPYDRQIVAGISAYTRSVDNWSLYIDDERVAKALAGIDIPVVGLGGGYRGSAEHAPSVYFDTDNHAIAQLAYDHLLERGFVRFGFCGMPQTRINRWAQERAERFQQIANAAGHSCSVYTGRYSSARQWQRMQKALQNWLRSLRLPVGILACNDARARHVLEACRALGLRVPEDVAVIGVDNDELMCELATPPLSSIEQGTRRLGYDAAALLDSLIDGEQPTERRIIIPPAQLIARHSTDVMSLGDPVLSRALRYLHSHACQGAQIEDIAAEAGCSRSSLEKRLRARLDRSVHAEIMRVKLRRVQELLIRSDLPLKAIADRAGFGSMQYMATVFRKATGLTPGQFRQRESAGR